MDKAVTWHSFGASIIGPGHLAAGKPNQDSWLSFHNSWGDGIAVSDGIGSKPFSEFGSLYACYSVKHAACNLSQTAANENLLSDIHNNWLDLIKPLSPRDASATCLFVFRLNDGKIRAGLLGDGLIAGIKNDNSIIIINDDKSEGFSNITTPLSETMDEKAWQLSVLPEEDYALFFLCTDGVSEDLDDTEGFVRNFASTARQLPAITAARFLREMLEEWPVPKHTDDKTIACFYKRDFCDE